MVLRWYLDIKVLLQLSNSEHNEKRIHLHQGVVSKIDELSEYHCPKFWVTSNWMFDGISVQSANLSAWFCNTTVTWWKWQDIERTYCFKDCIVSCRLSSGSWEVWRMVTASLNAVQSTITSWLWIFACKASACIMSDKNCTDSTGCLVSCSFDFQSQPTKSRILLDNSLQICAIGEWNVQHHTSRVILIRFQVILRAEMRHLWCKKITLSIVNEFMCFEFSCAIHSFLETQEMSRV